MMQSRSVLICFDQKNNKEWRNNVKETYAFEYVQSKFVKISVGECVRAVATPDPNRSSHCIAFSSIVAHILLSVNKVPIHKGWKRANTVSPGPKWAPKGCKIRGKRKIQSMKSGSRADQAQAMSKVFDVQVICFQLRLKQRVARSDSQRHGTTSLQGTPGSIAVSWILMVCCREEVKRAEPNVFAFCIPIAWLSARSLPRALIPLAYCSLVYSRCRRSMAFQHVCLFSWPVGEHRSLSKVPCTM